MNKQTENALTEHQQKRKRNTQRLEQGKQEMRTQTQQEMGKGEIQIQTIPPTEDNQPDTKQPK